MVALAPPVLRPVLAAHLDDIEWKLSPGLRLLTWSSLNIDGYLHRIHQVAHSCTFDMQTLYAGLLKQTPKLEKGLP